LKTINQSTQMQSSTIIMDRQLILLFGMPRSGTTWIGKIFDSHPSVIYRHEPDSWKRMVAIPVISNSDEYEKYCRDITDYIEGLDTISLQPVVAKLPVFSKKTVGSIRYGFFRINVLLSMLLSRLFSKVKLPVISLVTPGKVKLMSMAWKSIESLGRLGVILKCNKRIKAIHIIRHPCGYISSVLSGESGGKFVCNTATSEDYAFFDELLKSPISKKYGLSIEKLENMQAIERLSWRWVLINEHAMSNTESERVFVLKYEDLCKKPVDVTKKMFEFTGLEWNEQTEKFLSNSTSKQSDAYYSVYKDPVKSSEKWKSKLESDEINAIRKIISGTIPGQLYEKDF